MLEARHNQWTLNHKIIKSSQHSKIHLERSSHLLDLRVVEVHPVEEAQWLAEEELLVVSQQEVSVAVDEVCNKDLLIQWPTFQCQPVLVVKCQMLLQYQKMTTTSNKLISKAIQMKWVDPKMNCPNQTWRINRRNNKWLSLALITIVQFWWQLRTHLPLEAISLQLSRLKIRLKAMIKIAMSVKVH